LGNNDLLLRQSKIALIAVGIVVFVVGVVYVVFVVEKDRAYFFPNYYENG